MRFHNATKRVFIRQSWLGDVVMCPERARLGATMPNMRSGSDATIMGTAVHYAIERVLGDSSIERDAMTEIALGKFADLQATESWKVTNINPDKYGTYIESMCTSWHNEIAPTVEFGGQVEYKFAYPLGIEVNGWSVWCEGTMDYVDPNGVVYDWKTASRAYNAREKQATAIQPTVYAGAVVSAGWTDFPVDFRYGVMVRNEKPKSQIVYVMRTEAHMRWLRHTVRPLIQMALTIGEDNNWMMNDTGHLCNERWCSYWSVCKGAFVSDPDMQVPDAPVTVTIDSGSD